MKNLAAKVTAYAKWLKKFLIGVAGTLGVVAASGLISGTALDVVQSLIAALALFGIYKAENAAKPA